MLKLDQPRRAAVVDPSQCTIAVVLVAPHAGMMLPSLHLYHIQAAIVLLAVRIVKQWLPPKKG